MTNEPERAEPRLRAARRGVSVETRPPARAVCRVHGARTGAGRRLASKRAAAGRQIPGRAVRRGWLARDKGGEWAAADASRGHAMAVPAGGRVQAVRAEEGRSRSLQRARAHRSAGAVRALGSNGRRERAMGTHSRRGSRRAACGCHRLRDGRASASESIACLRPCTFSSHRSQSAMGIENNESVKTTHPHNFIRCPLIRNTCTEKYYPKTVWGRGGGRREGLLASQNGDVSEALR